ncbi:hypothetical protein WJ0W_005781 [Paenibacillus melissococcoides]|uniref:Uncharacterized protein n=1 Tax=Paenibacillus melissococcoides TaxID=2912268 RepID=A0ABN8UGC2_9BACL|nr:MULTISPECIES: hypothetical protein [Paenibacillus]MEB9896784.1 hypothetical protein [Bacillus cereus]CAH8248597.1 hypothetical protein WJ0W_005781 [Paenibacillus melissococcoides]CAH8714294.1 hypothetical protein WDD9_003831 [Paenibacillus melissococcoides]CAH8719939.1 hypothetical protein HTL2_005776 [Paenibacillus melissococcoides]GIO79573.1 hypothetical protein J6TS7_31830 [Paenibacillus dendritiformis]
MSIANAKMAAPAGYHSANQKKSSVSSIDSSAPGIKVPASLLRDPYWGSMLHIFINHYKLNRYTAKYIDFTNESININGLRTASRPWSSSEKFMLKLGLHLFNERNKVNLSDMDCLDDNNRKIAMQAIAIRFRIPVQRGFAYD